MEVIIDTNALVYAAEKKIDIFSNLKFEGHVPIILECVIEELKSLSASSKRASDRDAAKLALQLIKVKPISVEEGKPDEIIANYAKAHKTSVLTNDRALKTKLKSLHIGVFSITESKQVRQA